MASRRTLFALALAACTLGVATPTLAFAEPTAAERETARGLMAQGRTQREAKDFRAALATFQAADAIMHVPTTGYEVARTQEMMGQLVEARDTLLRVLRIPEQPNEPAPFKEARTKAQALSDELEARVPAVRIALKGAAEGTPTVTIDGTAIPSAALSVPFKLNPGHHVFEAKTKTATGKAELDVAEKQTVDVEITLVSTAPEAPPPEKPPEEPPPPPPRPPANHTLTYSAFGVGAVGVVLGSVTGFLSISKKNDAANGCTNNKCPPATYDKIDSANTMATISTASFIVAGVGVGVGIISLVLRSDPAPAAPATGLRATPWIGLGSAGVSGSF